MVLKAFCNEKNFFQNLSYIYLRTLNSAFIPNPIHNIPLLNEGMLKVHLPFSFWVYANVNLKLIIIEKMLSISPFLQQ